MRKLAGMIACLGLVSGFFVAGEARAQTPKEKDFNSWLVELRADARAKGISKSTLDAALKGLTPVPRVVELDRKQPEFSLTFKQYLSRVVPKSRIRKGRREYQENKAQLDRVGRRFGVQPRFIVAFWGIETDFGRHSGGFSVVRALATLAFDGRRSRFFRAQLMHALRILEDGHITPRLMKGSWAGAMGQFQFMPSSFRAFAMDGDGDGRKDIWTNKSDAFASAANYLARSGWKGDQTWGRRVLLPQGFQKKLASLKIRKPLAEWQKLGLRRLGGGDLPKRQLKASVVLAGGPKGPTYLAYNNYRVTLKWNRSTFFAIAVGTLAEGIAGR